MRSHGDRHRTAFSNRPCRKLSGRQGAIETALRRTSALARGVAGSAAGFRSRLHRAQQPARRPRFDRARRFKCEGWRGLWSRQTSVCGAPAWIRTASLTSRLIRNEAQAFAQGVVYVRLHERRQGSGRTPACCRSPRPYRKGDLAKMIRAALAVRRRPISLRRSEMSCDRSVTARHSRRPTRIHSNDNVFVSSSTE
jgi:hypothetical protein